MAITNRWRIIEGEGVRAKEASAQSGANITWAAARKVAMGGRGVGRSFALHNREQYTKTTRSLLDGGGEGSLDLKCRVTATSRDVVLRHYMTFRLCAIY